MVMKWARNTATIPISRESQRKGGHACKIALLSPAMRAAPGLLQCETGGATLQSLRRRHPIIV
jgi:hypothetical protein